MPFSSDDQRKAFFARQHGGGSSRSSAPASASDFTANPDGSYRYTPANDTSWMDREARGISDATSDFAIAGLPGAGGALSALGRAGRALASWKTPILTALGASGIGSYRDSHPTLDPQFDHALALGEQILGYTSAITGLAQTKKSAGSELGKWDVTVHSAGGATTRTAAELLSVPFAKLGDTMTSLGKAVAGRLPGAVTKPLEKLYKAYTNVADFTGSSLTDALSVGRNRKALQLADEMRAQAALIESTAGTMAEPQLKLALDLLDRAHQLSKTGSSSAKPLYQQAARHFNDYASAQASSKATADAMRAFADKATAEAKIGLLKAATVGVGFAAKEGYDEWKIAGMQADAAQAFAAGEEWGIDPAQPRDGWETALAIAAGTLGNPIEKQFRYGQDSYRASVAAYRAKYDALKETARRDGWPADRLDKELNELARTKPRNMAGKAAWTFAPAAASFLVWKGGEYADRVRATAEAGVVTKVRDVDTVEINNDPSGIRWLGINAPEIDHGPGKPAEYLGDEGTAWQTGELLGRTVRLVKTHDGNGPLVDKDIFGQRSLAYLETLPRPFDKLLAVPVVGKLIPSWMTTDLNLRAIEEGYALPKMAHERLQGGKHDRRYEYDEAAAKAIAAKIGVNDREAGAASGLGQIPEYVPFAERKKREAAKKGYDIPDIPQSGLSTALGLGLMTTGQSGVFREMGPAGNAAAQLWNAVLAVRGGLEYNQQARLNPVPRSTRKPKGVKSDPERAADEVLERYSRGR